LAAPILAAQASPPPAANAASETPNATASASTAQDLDHLRQKEADYLRAELENSAALAGSVLAEDYVGIRSDGSSATKAEVLQSLSAHQGSRQPFTIGASNMREHLFGDTACITYTKVYTFTGRRQTYSENLLHIFTKRNGVWHLQVSSPMPEASSPPRR